MAYQGFGAPPPGGYGGVSEEGDKGSLEIPRDFKTCLMRGVMHDSQDA